MKKFNNVYIKNFNEEIDDEKLQIWFERFGKIISAKVGVQKAEMIVNVTLRFLESLFLVQCHTMTVIVTKTCKCLCRHWMLF